MPHETITYRRAELYEQVWKDPLTIVAQRYGVSAVAIGKTCRKLGVPLPGRGHWERKRAGQDLRRPPLRRPPPGKSEELLVRRFVPGAADLEAQAVVDAERAADRAIVVAPALDSPHPLVAKALKILGRQKPLHGRVWCHDEPCLSINVSPAQLDRALRLMDALIKGLVAREWRVEAKHELIPGRVGGPVHETSATIDGALVAFWISEMYDVQSVPPDEMSAAERRSNEFFKTRPPTRHVPNGLLELAFLPEQYTPGRSAWRDGKRQRLESCLSTFVAHMHVRAKTIKREQAEAVQRRAAEAAADERRREAERIAREEREYEKWFIERLDRWRLAKDLREFIAETRGLIAAAGLKIIPEGSLDRELRWAEGYASRVDPLSAVRKDIETVLRDIAESAPHTPSTPAANPSESATTRTTEA